MRLFCPMGLQILNKEKTKRMINFSHIKLLIHMLSRTISYSNLFNINNRRTIMIQDYELINNIEENQYEFHIEKHIAKIEYIRAANKEIYLTHTEVPTALEGQGIASALIKKVLEDIEHKGLRLIPLCPFVVGYIQKHPEWRKLVIR